MIKLTLPLLLLLVVFALFSCDDSGTDPEFAWEVVWNRPLADSTGTYFISIHAGSGDDFLAFGQARSSEADPWYPITMEIDTAANMTDTIEMPENIDGNHIYPRNIAFASDNSILLTGAVGAPDRQLLALRAGVTGNIISDTSLGGTNNEYGNSIVETSDNGFAVVGWSASDIATSAAIYLCRFNQAGELLWQEKYIKGFSAQGEALTLNDNDGFILGGTAVDDFAGNDYIYLLNVDADGDTIWTRQLGGSGNDLCEDMIRVADGVVVAGWTGSLGAGEYDIYLGKVAFNGNVLWEKGLGSTANEAFKSISETSGGGFILTAGESGTLVNNAKAYIVKVDSSGDIVWEIYLQDEPGEEYEIVGAVELDIENILILTQTDNLDGTWSSNLMKIKLSGV